MAHTRVGLVVAVFLMLSFQDCYGVNTCTLNDYFLTSVPERFVQSSIVVYGRTIQHVANKVPLDGSFQYVIDAVYEVYCVLRRGEDVINEQILITGIAPRDWCSGTQVSSLMKVGDHSIVALTNQTGGHYIFDEIMVGTSAAVAPLKPYLFSLSKMCDMQKWHAPAGAATNRCPICGTSDFQPEVRELYNAHNTTNTCIYGANTVVTNMTECDLYMDYSISDANAQTCIPASYNQTCVALLTRALTAVCDCNVKKDVSGVGVGTGTVLQPSHVVMATILLSAICLQTFLWRN